MGTAHKRYNIGLIVSDIEDDFSNHICQGVMEESEKMDNNLFIFPVKYLAPLSYFEAHPDILYEYQYNALLSYAQSRSLDAILLCLSCIGYKTTPDIYLPVLDMFPNTPVILLSCEEDGYPCVMYDNAMGVEEGLTRLICERGFTKIGMVSGDIDNTDVQERFAAYKNTLERYDIPFDESRVVAGGYCEMDKIRIGKWYDEHRDLEAIFCVNDTITELLYEALKERNVVIGKDIAIFGFDDIEGAAHMNPPLATVRADASLLGSYGIREAHSILNNMAQKIPAPAKRSVVPTTYLHRESASGVHAEAATESISALQYYKSRYEKMIDMNHKMNIVNRDMLMFGNDSTESYTALIHALSMEEIPSCYLYFLYRPLENLDPATWSRPANIYLHSYRNGSEITELPRTKQRLSLDEMFNHSHLPAERKTYILIDIYSREQQYGVFMCELPYEYFHYAEMICYQISTAVKITSLFDTQKTLMDDKESMVRKLQQENLKLDNISNTDVLTGIYNRRGFLTRLEHALTSKELQDKKALIFYIDLNYLKQINDGFSHEDGDFSIKLCAKALCSVLGEEALVGRIGGDEFVAFLITNISADYYYSKIKNYFAEFNRAGSKPYELSASVGIYPFDIHAGLAVDNLLEQADNLLYEDKHIKPSFRSKVTVPPCQGTTPQ